MKNGNGSRRVAEAAALLAAKAVNRGAVTLIKGIQLGVAGVGISARGVELAARGVRLRCIRRDQKLKRTQKALENRITEARVKIETWKSSEGAVLDRDSAFAEAEAELDALLTQMGI